MRLAFIFIFFMLPLQLKAQLEGTYEVIVRKQEEKRNSRWTLAEWLALKERNRWMDLWLAQNSRTSYYEFYLEGRALNYGRYESSHPDDIVNRNAYGGTFAAYAGVVGLRGGYDAIDENQSTWFGSLNIRLFGRALQDTHINLEYGLTGQDSFRNQFGAVSANLYLTRSFGLEGAYSKILPGQDEKHRSLEGESSRAGIFIDFGFLRVFGNWQKDFRHVEGAALPTREQFREGFGGGLRLYF